MVKFVINQSMRDQNQPQVSHKLLLLLEVYLDSGFYNEIEIDIVVFSRPRSFQFSLILCGNIYSSNHKEI